MTKQEVQQRVLQNGKPLSLDKFEWDEKTKTFSSDEGDLVLDFVEISGCTFVTGGGCTFKTWSDCTFKTGSDCTFDTGDRCTFNTGSECTFNTGSSCTFKTGEKCVVIRRDVYEVIELTEGKKIRLNEYGVKGYKVLVKKPKKVVLTMDEIAEKFGVDVKNLKIKK